jgi:hypothetical protein
MTVLAEVKTSPFDTCGCSYARDNRQPSGDDAELEGYRLVHDTLMGIEDGGAVAVLSLLADIMEGSLREARRLEDLDRFAAEHNWRDPVGVWEAFHHLQWCKDKMDC